MNVSPLYLCSRAAAEYFKGGIDELGMWNRALHANEIKQLYQRGASRLKYQVRTCGSGDATCTAATWKGPDGTSATYFSELNNNSVALDASGDVKATLPSMLFSQFTSPPSNNQYFQYRAIFESDTATTALIPELKSTNVDPLYYDNSNPSIFDDVGVSTYTMTSFTETIPIAGCPGGVGYNLSLDKISWKWWNGASWAVANGTHANSNTAAQINANLSTFKTQVGSGIIYTKAYLHSDGTTKCELDNINITGKR